MKDSLSQGGLWASPWGVSTAFIDMGRPTLNVGDTFWWGTDKRCGRRKLFGCFVHLTFQACWPGYPIAFEGGSFADSGISFFGMQNSSPRVPWAFGTRLGWLSHPTSCTEHIFSYRLLWCKAVIDGLLPQCHLSQSNKFSLTCIISVGSVLENPDQCIDCSGH